MESEAPDECAEVGVFQPWPPVVCESDEHCGSWRVRSAAVVVVEIRLRLLRLLCWIWGRILAKRLALGRCLWRISEINVTGGIVLCEESRRLRSIVT